MKYISKFIQSNDHRVQFFNLNIFDLFLVNELAKRNVHRVPKETISNMLSR